jgi:hypothetical protein
MYLQVVAGFSLCGKLGNPHDSVASKCYGAVAFTNNSSEIQGRAPELASSSTSADLTKKLQILVSDTAGGIRGCSRS